MPSFDVVSEVDSQEVLNAVQQAQKEIAQRYDFRGSKSSIELKEKESAVTIIADDKGRLDAIHEILKQRFAKRGVSLKSLEWKDPEAASGDTLRQVVVVKQGLTPEEIKRLNKLIKDTKLKVSSQAQGDQLRVTGKNRDDLQSAIQYLRGEVKDIELQYINFRD
jgi:uncharacterized protein YajQ (UPF0234 family)